MPRTTDPRRGRPLSGSAGGPAVAGGFRAATGGLDATSADPGPCGLQLSRLRRPGPCPCAFPANGHWQMPHQWAEGLSRPGIYGSTGSIAVKGVS